MSWRMAAGLLGVLVALGGCVSSADIEAVRRDVAALRQEVAGLAKTNEGARAFTDERLSKLEADLRSRFETTVKEGEGARAALALRLDELVTETRLVQGKLEENAFVLGNLNSRLDEMDQQERRTAGRMDGLERELKAMDQRVRAPSPSPPALPPTGQASEGAPPAGQPSAGPPPAQPVPAQPPAPAAGQAPGTPPPVAQPPATPPPAPPATPAPPTGPVAVAPTVPRPSQVLLPPEELYKNALSDYTKGNYDLANAGFKTYIQSYPKTSLVPNAQYWLGESYYSQKNYAQAIEEFDVVIRDYPDSPKVPSALFKQGDAYLLLGDTKRATTVLCELLSKHPRTREARLARERNIRCR
jgi:tol-pal system protein YbgF